MKYHVLSDGRHADLERNEFDSLEEANSKMLYVSGFLRFRDCVLSVEPIPAYVPTPYREPSPEMLSILDRPYNSYQSGG